MVKIQKLSAIIVITLTVLVCASVSVYAFTDVNADNPYAAAINELAELKVVQGKTEAEFAPNDPVTRLQMAIFMARASTAIVDDELWLEGDDRLFSDCTSYLGAVQYCFTRGIIKGVTDSEFAPNEGITLRDGLIMAVRSLGYENDDNWEYKVEGANYWLPYYQKAEELGLTNKLSNLSPTSKLNRGATAQLVYNMLNGVLYNKADDYNNKYTLADKVFGGKQTENIESIVAGFISETPMQSIGYDTIPDDEETVVITVLDEESGNPVVEVPFKDLEEAGVDTENIEEYFGAYIELINCRRVYNYKDEDGYSYIYQDYEYLSGAYNGNVEKFTNYAVKYTDAEDRIRISGKTHYLSPAADSNYIALYEAFDKYDGWQLMEGEAEEISEKLKGRYYDITVIDTDRDGYYEIGLVSMYNIGRYRSADSDGYARFGVMAQVNARKVKYSQSVASNSVIVYTYDPFNKYVDVKEVLTKSEGKIQSYNHEYDDGDLYCYINIDNIEYTVVDRDTDGDSDIIDDDDDMIVGELFWHVEGLSGFVVDTIEESGMKNLGRWTKEMLRRTVNENVSEAVEYYTYDDKLLAIGAYVEDEDSKLLLVKEWTGYEIGKYVTLEAYVDGIKKSINTELIYTLNSSGELKKNVIPELGKGRLLALLKETFGLYKYTVDEDGMYVLKECSSEIKLGDYFGKADEGIIRFSNFETVRSDVPSGLTKDVIRINEKTVICTVNTKTQDVEIITPSSGLVIEFDNQDVSDAVFITDHIGKGILGDKHYKLYDDYDITYGISSYIYIITDNVQTSINRAKYKIVYVDKPLTAVKFGTAENFRIEASDEDEKYFLYESEEENAYIAATFDEVNKIYVSGEYREDYLGNSIMPGMYLLDKYNVVVDHILEEDFEATNRLYAGSVDFVFYTKSIKANEIRLFDDKAIIFSSDDADLSKFEYKNNIKKITFRFFEENEDEVIAVDKSDETLVNYISEHFGKKAVDIVVIPNSYTGYDFSLSLPGNTFRGIVYKDSQQIDE